MQERLNINNFTLGVLKGRLCPFKDVQKYLCEFLHEFDFSLIHETVFQAQGQVPLIDCEYAATRGYLRIFERIYNHSELQWACVKGRICGIATRAGQLKLLQWARAHGARWGSYCCEYAAERGDLEMLQWLVFGDNGNDSCPWDEWVCAKAALGGHLNVLQWLRSRPNFYPAPWDEWTCRYAAFKGHLDILKWALDEGAPCSDLRYWAERGGSIEVLKWLDAPVIINH
jgi:hypothetical protein